jgi:hypothetical protein
MVRKTIIMSAVDVATSPKTEGAAARDAVPITLTLKSMSGKFLFTSTSLDKVTFNGTVGLPAGYTPKLAAGNDITVALGNVLDVVHLDSKGKLTVPTLNARITRFRLTPPHLATGVAVGGESARVSMTMNVGDLDLLGFDTEGVTPSVRSDEAGMTSVQRFIQVDMLVGGQDYQVLAPVDFKLAKDDSFGSIQGRN